MSHEITERVDGTYEFASVTRTVEDRPWHRVGKDVMKPNGESMTTGEAIVEAQMGWTVRKENQLVQSTGEVVPDKFAIVRNDNNKYMGTVGGGYEIVQNAEAFDWFDGVLGKKNAPIIETAGSLFEGRKIFISAKLPDTIKVLNGVGKKADHIEKYLFLSSSHDASGSIICGFTPVRIVCNNTLQMALKEADNVIRIKHTKNVKERLAMASKIMKMVDGATTELTASFNKMSKVKITDQRLREYIACVMSTQEKIVELDEFEKYYSTKNLNLTDRIMEYALTNESQQFDCTKGTLYGAYQAITGYFQNVKEYDSQEEKLDELVLANGSTAQKKMIRAYDFALSMM